MLKYNITFSDHGIDISAQPQMNPAIVYNEEQRLLREQQKPWITEEADGAQAESIGRVANNDEAVSAMSLAARTERFEQQIKRALELLGKRGLNKSAMHYIMTGERPERGRRRASQASKKR